MLERAGNEVLEDRRGEQISSTNVKAGDHPGRVVTFRSPESGFAIEEARLVLAGSRLFLLTAGRAKEGDDRLAMDRFFDSLRIWDEPARDRTRPAADRPQCAEGCLK